MPDAHTQKPIQTYCSFVREDEPLLQKLVVHLIPLQHQGLISGSRQRWNPQQGESNLSMHSGSSLGRRLCGETLKREASLRFQEELIWTPS